MAVLGRPRALEDRGRAPPRRDLDAARGRVMVRLNRISPPPCDQPIHPRLRYAQSTANGVLNARVSLGAFLKDNAVAITFGIISLITALLAIYYARKSYHLERRSPERNSNRSVIVYWTREDMISSLLEQYTLAQPGEEIWAHAVGLQNFPGEVHNRIMTAAAKGVTFRYLVQSGHPATDEFVNIFRPIRSAEIAAAPDNRLRVQGLSGREVVVAFPTLTTYTAIRVTDPEFVAVLEEWFDRRWATAVKNHKIL